MSSCPYHAAGISIAAVCSTLRPPRYTASNALSSDAVSEAASSSQIGSMSSMNSPNRSDRRFRSRADIQLRLPRTVFISPLCANNLYGCASFHDPRVFVLNRA